jgi:hypothetical protein
MNQWLLPILALGAWRLRVSRDVTALVLSSVGGPLLMFLVTATLVLSGKSSAGTPLIAAKTRLCASIQSRSACV